MQPKKRRKYECQKTEEGIKCLGSLTLQYEEQAPVFICDKCGDRNETWKKFYNEYLKLYTKKSNWEEPKNQVSCILGLFCSKYYEKYHTSYTFVPRNPNPYSAKECKDAWTMLAAFNNQALDVRRYIIWSFAQGIGSNARITSLAYLNTPGLIRRFKLWNEKRKTPTRSTQLPKEFSDWCRENAQEVFNKYSFETMNDLGAVFNYAKTYPDESTIELKVVEHAIQLGLIKNNKLNIGR